MANEHNSNEEKIPGHNSKIIKTEVKDEHQSYTASLSQLNLPNSGNESGLKLTATGNNEILMKSAQTSSNSLQFSRSFVTSSSGSDEDDSSTEYHTAAPPQLRALNNLIQIRQPSEEYHTYPYPHHRRHHEHHNYHKREYEQKNKSGETEDGNRKQRVEPFSIKLFSYKKLPPPQRQYDPELKKFSFKKLFWFIHFQRKSAGEPKESSKSENVINDTEILASVSKTELNLMESEIKFRPKTRTESNIKKFSYKRLGNLLRFTRQISLENSREHLPTSGGDNENTFTSTSLQHTCSSEPKIPMNGLSSNSFDNVKSLVRPATAEQSTVVLKRPRKVTSLPNLAYIKISRSTLPVCSKTKRSSTMITPSRRLPTSENPPHTNNSTVRKRTLQITNLPNLAHERYKRETLPTTPKLKASTIGITARSRSLPQNRLLVVSRSHDGIPLPAPNRQTKHMKGPPRTISRQMGAKTAKK